MRKHYLDNIRSITILLVVIFHVFFFFNPLLYTTGRVDKVISFPSLYQSFVYPWFMALLFLVSGIASSYSLKKRDCKTFIKERAKKTLMPSVVSVLLFGWISGSIVTTRATSEVATLPSVVKYIIYTLSGIQGLWFLQVLFVNCLILILIKKLDKADKISQLGAKTNLLVILTLFFITYLMGFVLNGKVVLSYRMGFYLSYFLIGYYVLSSDKVEAILIKFWPLFLILSLVGYGFYLPPTFTKYYGGLAVLERFDTNLFAYFFSLALLGFFAKYCNKTNKVLGFANKVSFGVYVLHIPIILVINELLTRYASLSLPLTYLILLITALPLSVGLYLLIHKVKGLRFIMFGEN